MLRLNRMTLIAVAMGAIMLASCATTPLTGEETDVSDAPGMTVGVGVPVLASAETVAVGTANADAADDPAIWVDRADRARAVVFGTDKKAGLYAYRLDGSVLQNLDGGEPNNVDLRDGFAIDGRSQVLVAASDRSPDRFGITLFIMDPASLQTRYWGLIPVDLAEPYGLCVGKREDRFVVIINGTDGQVRQVAVSIGADGRPVGTVEKQYAVGSQTEGCVIDDEAGVVYIGEEAKGVWRYSLDPAQGSRRESIAQAPGEALVPDVEGLAMLKENGATWLLASSQGDSAFAIWRVDGPTAYRGRFSVVGGGGIDAVTGTDGIAALAGPVGGFAQGLIVVQDDVDEIPGGTGERQNFKLVDWAAIKAALGL